MALPQKTFGFPFIVKLCSNKTSTALMSYYSIDDVKAFIIQSRPKDPNSECSHIEDHIFNKSAFGGHFIPKL
jgi:hypothetical protein